MRDAPGRRDPAWISGAFVAAAQLAQPTGRQEGPPSGAARACRIPYSARVSGNPALGWAGAGWMGDGATTKAGFLIGRDCDEECIHVWVAILFESG